MMKLSVKRVIVSLSLCLITLGIFAQQKNLSYYNTHESEILPDARIAFRSGEYERTVELCRWHYIIVGDNKADSLREKSERCAKLTKEMDEFRENGNVKDAKLRASAILSLNPDDAAATAMLLVEDPLPPVPDTIIVESPVKPTEPVTPLATEESQIETIVEHEPEPVQIQEVVTPSAPVISEPERSHVIQEQAYDPHTRFIIKAGASILDLKQVSQTLAPGGTIGFYDIGGSRVGGEIGGYLCPLLPAYSVSLYGLDAAVVMRAAKGIYPKLLAGLFSCKPIEKNYSTTSGICAGAGITFLAGRHFCLEVGAKYYPEVCVKGSEKAITTPGISYDFPFVKLILSSGVAPFISVGYAF